MNCCGRWQFYAMSEYLLETEIPTSWDRRQRTEDRGRRAEDRGQKTEDRRRIRGV